MVRIAINVAKVSAGWEFREAASAKMENRGGDLQFVGTGVVSRNNNDIIRAIGAVPVKGRGFTL